MSREIKEEAGEVYRTRVVVTRLVPWTRFDGTVIQPAGHVTSAVYGPYQTPAAAKTAGKRETSDYRRANRDAFNIGKDEPFDIKVTFQKAKTEWEDIDE